MNHFIKQYSFVLFDLNRLFLRHFNISYEQLVISSNKMRQKQILSVLWAFYIVWNIIVMKWMKEMISEINIWLIRDKNPLMSLHYQFGFTMYRLNRRQEIKEMIGWFWFMDCLIKNPWIHGINSCNKIMC